MVLIKSLIETSEKWQHASIDKLYNVYIPLHCTELVQNVFAFPGHSLSAQ